MFQTNWDYKKAHNYIVLLLGLYGPSLDGELHTTKELLDIKTLLRYPENPQRKIKLRDQKEKKVNWTKKHTALELQEPAQEHYVAGGALFTATHAVTLTFRSVVQYPRQQ